jgi:hypothetical protein
VGVGVCVGGYPRGSHDPRQGVTPQQATEFSASAELSGRWRVPGLTGWYSNREVGFKVVRQPRLLDLNERGRSHPEPVAPSPRQPEPRVTIR